MKKIFTLLCFVMCAGILSAQGPPAPALKVDINGNVGIGTANPTDLLHVQKDQPGGVLFKVENTSGAANGHAIFTMKTAAGGGNSRMQWSAPGAGTWYMGLDNQDANRVKFVWNDASLSSNERFVIKTSGDIGVGTGSPDAKLSVNGDASKTGGGEWSTFSDRRLKSNVNEFNYGLEHVMKINPVTFEYNGILGLEADKEHVGVIAQEIQKVAPFMVYEGETTDRVPGTENDFVKNKMGYLKYDGSALKYMLVNAVKDQQGQIEDLKQENQELRDMVNELIEKFNSTVSIEEDKLEDVKSAALMQNVPNPFNQNTSISYFIPEGSKKASIQISNQAGQLLRTIDISNTGKGQLDLNAENIGQGGYFYTLVIDGQSIGTKKMIKLQ